MREYEKKIKISAAEYELIRTFGFGDVKTQVNYYYDTYNYNYNRKNITLRIREKNGEYEATVKKHYTVPKDYSTEETVSCRDENDTELFCDSDVKLMGKMVTERCISGPQNGIKIMLDHNHYLGGHDFEVEVEYRDGMEDDAYFHIKSIAACLAHYGLIQAADDFTGRDMNNMCKSQRFFRRLSEKHTACNHNE